MKKLCRCQLVALFALACNSLFAQQNTDQYRGAQISLLNGLNNFANKGANDSVYFLKSGINLGVQGNYFWKNIGIAGRLGYFTNNSNEGKISDFGMTRKASPDRMLIATRPYKGFYWMAGPAFQTTFNRWQVESNMLGGMFHNDDAGVYIGDRVSPELVYYRNKVESGSSFAWNVGLGINYSISTLIRLGLTADYLSTHSEVTNTDINRNNGAVTQQISSQANFISTALKLSYNLSRKTYDNRNTWHKSMVSNNPGKTTEHFEKGDKPTEQQKPATDCECENKTMEVAVLEPQKIDITFTTLQEAQEFLKSNNPLYHGGGIKGDNPLHQSSREASSGMATGLTTYTTKDNNDPADIAIDEPGVQRGAVLRTTTGEQVFALFPSLVNLGRIAQTEGGVISVNVKNDGDTSTMQQRSWRNNNTVRSNRTDNALKINDDNNNSGGLDIILFQDAAGKTSVAAIKNSFREAGSGMATGKRLLPTVNKRTLPIRIGAGDDNTAKAIVTNNTQRGGSATLNSQTSTTRQTQKRDFGERSGVATGAGAAAGAACKAGDPIHGVDVKMVKLSDHTSYTVYTNEEGFIELNDEMPVGEYELTSIGNGKWNNYGVTVMVGDKDMKEAPENIVPEASASYKVSCPPQQKIRCADGTCTISGTITMNGIEYPAEITARIKTMHDMQMGAIRNLK